MRDRPIVFVKVYADGKTAKTNGISGEPVDITDRILKFKFEDEEYRADKCEITFDNYDLSQFDNPLWRLGSIVEVKWGYPGNMSPLRRMVIQKVKGGREFRIEAHGLEMLLHKVKETKVYEGKTLYDIASDVFQQFKGLLSEAQLLDSKDPHDAGDSVSSSIDAGIATNARQIQIARAHQSAETKAQFLSRLAKKYGYVFYIDDQGFVFKPIDQHFKDAATKKLVWFNGDGDWIDFDYEADATGKHEAVSHHGVDAENMRPASGKASNDETSRNGLGPNVTQAGQWRQDNGQIVTTLREKLDGYKARLAGLKGGAGASGATSGGLEGLIDGLTKAKDTIEKAPAMFDAIKAKAEEVDRSPVGTTDPRQMKQTADGKYKKRQKHKHNLHGKLLGDPSFKAKTILKVEGIGRRLSGRWEVGKVDHEIDHQGGYVCEFRAFRDADNGYGSKSDANSKASQASKATQNEDPRDKLRFDWSQKSGTISNTPTVRRGVK